MIIIVSRLPMALKTDSNRTENLAGQNPLSSGVPVNTCGLPALPDELYLEILGHLPALPIPHDVWLDEKRDPNRQLTLYYLSQTCQSLRNFFLRYAWERIEGVLIPKRIKRSHYIEDPFRRLAVVVRNPNLRQFVSSVIVKLFSNLSSF